jgi:hypothetical protein
MTIEMNPCGDGVFYCLNLRNCAMPMRRIFSLVTAAQSTYTSTEVKERKQSGYKQFLRPTLILAKFQSFSYKASGFTNNSPQGSVNLTQTYHLNCITHRFVFSGSPQPQP